MAFRADPDAASANSLICGNLLRQILFLPVHYIKTILLLFDSNRGFFTVGADFDCYPVGSGFCDREFNAFCKLEDDRKRRFRINLEGDASGQERLTVILSADIPVKLELFFLIAQPADNIAVAQARFAVNLAQALLIVELIIQFAVMVCIRQPEIPEINSSVKRFGRLCIQL